MYGKNGMQGKKVAMDWGKSTVEGGSDKAFSSVGASILGDSTTVLL